ncbi:peptidylprolyl isomerase [Vibrio sp.]|uniref:peptidylprolyl isomerase n=1 Tax=Vibrio sp. TaxID=678 RepID=UPI003D0E52F7
MAKQWLLFILTVISTNLWAGPKVKFETSSGEFIIELNQEQAPLTTANFLKYVKDGSYTGTLFHRVIPGFMVQGGGFDEKMVPKESYPPIKNEASNGLANNTATVAMARTTNPDSATRQFFINLVDNDFLNASTRQDGYAVFGKVIEGFSTIQDMATQPTHTKGRMSDVPITPIIVTKVTLID